MASENNVPRKVNFSTRNPLRRSLSTTSLGLMLATHLNLRDTKSYTGGMEADAKSESSDDTEVKNELLKEVTFNTNAYTSINDEIETRDLATNEIVTVKADILQHGGRQYSVNEIAHLWKKDCRIWLWKNCMEFKKDKSVGEKIKAGFIKLKEYAI